MEEVIDEERTQKAVVHLSDNDLGAFIGSKGSHVREFEETHRVRVQAMKSEPGTLQILGNTEGVTKAKLALDFWVTVRGNPAVANAPDADGSETKDYSNDAPPVSTTMNKSKSEVIVVVKWKQKE